MYSQRLRSLGNGVGRQQISLSFAAGYKHKLVKLGVVLQEGEQFAVGRSLGAVDYTVVRTQEERNLQLADSLQHVGVVFVLALRTLIRRGATSEQCRSGYFQRGRAYIACTLRRAEVGHGHRRRQQPVVKFVVRSNLTRLGNHLTVSVSQRIGAVGFTRSVRTAVVTSVDGDDEFRRVVNACLNREGVAHLEVLQRAVRQFAHIAFSYTVTNRAFVQTRQDDRIGVSTDTQRCRRGLGCTGIVQTRRTQRTVDRRE